jgi:hypothetical protein
MHPSLRLGVLCTLLMIQAACGDRAPADDARAPAPAPATAVTPAPEGDPTPQMFFGIPVIPGARIVAGTAGAAEARIEIPLPADTTAGIYRRILVRQSWEIRGDNTAPDGSVTLHARSAEGRPVWIIIRPLAPGLTEVSLIATAASPASPPN